MSVMYVCIVIHLPQRYDGDVGDLGLTLSYDEDVMGQVWHKRRNNATIPCICFLILS